MILTKETLEIKVILIMAVLSTFLLGCAEKEKDFYTTTELK